MTNIIHLRDAAERTRRYPRRIDTAHDTYACEVILILDDMHDMKQEVRDLVKRCLNIP